MDEIQKTEMRNYGMSAGFFVIAVSYLLEFASPVFGMQLYSYGPILDMINPIISFVLILIGVMLLVLRKRDLTAMVFSSLGMMNLVLAFDTGLTLAPAVILGAFMIILALMIIFAKGNKKYLLFLLPLIIGLKTFLFPLIGFTNPIILALTLIAALIAVYYSLACASERVTFPLSKTLRDDIDTDFRSVGSIVGYLLISIFSVFWSTFYFFGSSVFDFKGALAVDMMCGAMVILTGVLLAIFGKMRFTPFMFILIGFVTITGSFVSGPMNIVLGVMMILLSLFCILRIKWRVLPALMIFLLGIAYLLPGIFGESVSPVFGGINLGAALIALYLAAAIFSSDYTDDKLPLF